MPIRQQFHEKDRIYERDLTDKEVLEMRMLPPVPYFATVVSVDWGKEKSAVVQLDWMGYKFNFEVHTLETAKPRVKAGDIVMLMFRENDYTKGIILDRIARP